MKKCSMCGGCMVKEPLLSGSVQKGAIPRFRLPTYYTLNVVLAVLECAGLQKCHSEVSH